MKKIVFIRHGHRDRAVINDNGLSVRGHKQAAEAAKEIYERWSGFWKKAEVKIITSPKKRCQETAKEIAFLLGAKVTDEKLLVEAKPQEDYAHFKGRVQDFLEKYKKQNFKILIACSHSDWIPVAVNLLLDMSSSVENAAFFEIDLEKEPQLVYRWGPAI